MRPLENESLGDLLDRLSIEVRTLVQKEVELAKVELGGKARVGGRNAVLLALGAALAYAGLLVLLGALVAALALVLPVWASALIVGLAVVLTAATLAMIGIRGLSRMDLTPERTLRTLKEDQRWLQNRATAS